MIHTSLSGEAIRCYCLLNELSLWFDLIGWETFETRMRWLDDELAGVANTGSEPLPPGDADHSDERVAISALSEAPADACGAQLPEAGPEAPPLWYIPEGGIAHLKRWHFHKGDPDPHPSVPHGHDNARRFPKLDPYLGNIHISTSGIRGRLSKADIRALWNDQSFRDFASAALLHFVRENPRYVMRVQDPLRLPRRR